MTPRFSLQDSIRFQRKTKLASREERRKKLRAWASMTRSLLEAQGRDGSGLSDAKAAMMFYRRRKKPMVQISQQRFFPQAREALLKTLEKQHA